MTEAEKIAAGLSEAMKDALSYYPSKYADPNTIRALRRRGLTSGSLLTELGTAVRAALSEREK